MSADNPPDLLSRLHTLRSLAHDVKRLADAQHLWMIAVRCAEISETATSAINSYNANHPNTESKSDVEQARR